MLRSPMKRRHASTGPSHDVVDALLERAQYCCERCGDMLRDRRGMDWSVHHRRARKAGGTRWAGINLPSNLMIVCGSGTQGCHGEIESRRGDSTRCGYLVPSTTDPATAPVLITEQRWVYLTDGCEYSDSPPAGEP